MRRRWKPLKRVSQRLRGTIVVEYLILITIVGIGICVGLALVQGALLHALRGLAHAIKAIVA